MTDHTEHRRQICAWLETGGQYSFTTRMEALASAFGISEAFILRTLYLNPMKHGSGVGPYLLDEIHLWVEEHQDLSHNNPDHRKTPFADMDLG